MLVIRLVGGTVVKGSTVIQVLIEGSIEWFHQTWLIDELNNAMERKGIVSWILYIDWLLYLFRINSNVETRRMISFLHLLMIHLLLLLIWLYREQSMQNINIIKIDLWSFREGRYYIEDSEKSFYLLPELLTYHYSKFPKKDVI